VPQIAFSFRGAVSTLVGALLASLRVWGFCTDCVNHAGPVRVPLFPLAGFPCLFDIGAHSLAPFFASGRVWRLTAIVWVMAHFLASLASTVLARSLRAFGIGQSCTGKQYCCSHGKDTGVHAKDLSDEGNANIIRPNRPTLGKIVSNCFRN
jgi:hypothetical protein